MRIVIAAIIAGSSAFGFYPLLAKDSLGVFDQWGAFRDPSSSRCYAIAKAAPSSLRRDYNPYVTIGTWPKKNLRTQVHFRLSRKIAPDKPVSLIISGEKFPLVGGGGDAWAANVQMDAAITASMRSASSMTIGATGRDGKRFSNTYNLSGAATAMDAATVGCARIR
ncbi:MAG: hypothetical protein ACK5NN_14880 [Sphingomonadaceae bacterium]